MGWSSIFKMIDYWFANENFQLNCSNLGTVGIAMVKGILSDCKRTHHIRSIQTYFLFRHFRFNRTQSRQFNTNVDSKSQVQNFYWKKLSEFSLLSVTKTITKYLRRLFRCIRAGLATEKRTWHLLQRSQI